MFSIITLSLVLTSCVITDAYQLFAAVTGQGTPAIEVPADGTVHDIMIQLIQLNQLPGFDIPCTAQISWQGQELMDYAQKLADLKIGA